MTVISDRDMPVLRAEERNGLWYVTLPGGREIICPDTETVRRVVGVEAPGSSIRWVPDLTEAEVRAQWGDK